jgi:hypothetical protein
MLRFQKLTRNVFLALHGHNLDRQQRQLYKFLMRYQQFVSHAYCGAVGPVYKMASHQEKAFCVLRFEMSRSVITVQREFRARLRKDAWCTTIEQRSVLLILLAKSMEAKNNHKEMLPVWADTNCNTIKIIPFLSPFLLVFKTNFVLIYFITMDFIMNDMPSVHSFN